MLIFLPELSAKVAPPNYDFSLDNLQKFMPGGKLEQIEKEFGKGEFFYRKGKYKVLKYYVEHIRYRFPIFVQFRDDQVIDFHASLPTYFLHDVFHRSIIKRMGKQDKFFNSSEHSVYIWNNANGNQIVYSSTCTITCFPLYYSVMPAKRLVQDGYKPFIEILKGSEASQR